MKKKIMLTFAALGAASMLCGFDNAETADSVLQKMQEATLAAQDMTSDIKFNADADVNVSDGTTSSAIKLSANGSLSTVIVNEPLSMQLDLSADLGMMGINQNYIYQMYMVPAQDGGQDVYVYTENSATQEGTWKHTTSSAELTEIQDALLAADPSALTDLGLTFELTSEAALENGKECPVLTTTIDSTTFATLLEQAGKADSSLNTQNVMDMIGGLKINISYIVDPDTYLPVRTLIDMNDSDVSALSTLLAGVFASAEDGTTAELVLNDISAELNFAFDSGKTIDVPAEAAAVPVTTPGELAAELGGVAE